MRRRAVDARAPSHRGPAPVVWSGLLALLLLSSACELVGGGGDGDADDDVAVAPGARLGSVALTADCTERGEGSVESLSLTGTYDCEDGFTVDMKNDSSTGSGPLRMRLSLGDVEAVSEEPIPGPTTTPQPEFAFVSAEVEGGSCGVDGAVVCELDSLPPAAAISVTVQISPPPLVATVTTEVVLFQV
jgi:hypothetical protein